MKIINSEKTERIPLTKKDYESYLYQKNCHIYKKQKTIPTFLWFFTMNQTMNIILS